MSRTVRARIGSARLILAGLADDPHMHRAQSQAHRDIIVAELLSTTLTPLEKQELTILCSQVAWADGHAENIHRLLSPTCRETRSRMQSYESIVEFYRAGMGSASLD